MISRSYVCGRLSFGVLEKERAFGYGRTMNEGYNNQLHATSCAGT